MQSGAGSQEPALVLYAGKQRCDNLPEIYEKYTTAMRYKAAAKKLKQVVELADPTPADVVLPHGSAEQKEGKRDYGADEETVVEAACGEVAARQGSEAGRVTRSCKSASVGMAVSQAVCGTGFCVAAHPPQMASGWRVFARLQFCET